MSKNKMGLLLLLTCLLLSGCGRQPQETGQENQLLDEGLQVPQEANYNTTEVFVGSYEKTVQGTAGRGASIEFVTKEDLVWETKNARFQEILVREGDYVREGDVLAVFDLEADTVALKELELELTRAREELARGRQDYEDAIAEALEATKEEGMILERLRIAELKVEKQRIAYEKYVYQAEKNIAVLEEDLAELREEIEVNTLTAPFDGVISWVISYSKGDKVTAGAKLISMYSPNEFYLKTTDHVGTLGYKKTITMEAGNKNDRKTYEGQVISSPEILPGTVKQNFILIQLEEGVRLDQLTGTVNYKARAEEMQDILLVKKNAISSENGKSYVYLLEDDIVKKRYVLTGIGNSDYTWILSGLEAGQKLILD